MIEYDSILLCGRVCYKRNIRLHTWSNCQKHYSPDILREAMQKTVKHCLAQGELLHSAQVEFGSPILLTIRIAFWAPDCSTLFVLQSGLYGSGTPLCTLVFLGQLLDSVLGE